MNLRYRHIDTALPNQNDNGVGKGNRECGAKREGIVITTKLGLELKTHDETVYSITTSVSNSA